MKNLLPKWGIHFDISGKENRVEELERKIEEPGFWDAPEESQKIMKELKDLQEHLKVIHALYSEYDDICTLIEMVDEEEDRSMVKEIEKDIAHFEEDFEKLRIETLLSGEYDSCNAIMTLHAGTGGTEACDWVNMLYRMYTRWFQTKGFSVQVLDYLDGDITGIKNITFEVVGDNAYGYLKSEKVYIGL